MSNTATSARSPLIKDEDQIVRSLAQQLATGQLVYQYWQIQKVIRAFYQTGATEYYGLYACTTPPATYLEHLQSSLERDFCNELSVLAWQAPSRADAVWIHIRFKH